MSEQGDSGVLFAEVQRFRQVWILLLMLFLALTAWVELIIQMVFKLPFGPYPVSDILAWIVWILFGIGLPLLFYTLRLTVQVKKDGIYLSFFPFIRSKIFYFKDLEGYEARRYQPIAEYGGWGIRMSTKHGLAYNVSGNMGVQLTLRNGKKILIGSQRAEEFARAITRAMR